MQAKDGPNCRTVAVTLAEEQDRSEKDHSPEKSYRQHDALRVLLGAQRCIRQIDRWRNKYHQHGQKPDCEDPLVSTTQHVEIRPRRTRKYCPPGSRSALYRNPISF